jgi:mannose-1-phosphate guanylyltransferase
MDKNNYCVIMAGGVGSRFWPMSKTAHPKQFLDVLGIGRTLIQQTYDRLKTICPPENFYVVTNDIYYNMVKQQIPEMKPEHILTEPLRRNTAPCIAYANHKILKENTNANIIVAPADHLILKEEEFQRTILAGLDFTKNNNALLTLGIKPSRPDTGYGYIQVNNEENTKWENNQLKKVKTFTEKPNKEMAKFFVESGDFFWNSGIFIWSLNAINKAFDKHLPDVNNLFKAGAGIYNTTKEKEFINKTYAQCQNISIDYGVMEKADNVFVLKSDFGWSDLGTWGALYENRQKDENKNVLSHNNIMTYDTKNSIIHLPNDKLAVIQGLDNYIVVEADNTLLICKKTEEQMIKHFVNDVEIQKGKDYV